MNALLTLNKKRIFTSWKIYLAITIIILGSLYSLKSNSNWYNFADLKSVGAINLFIFSNIFLNNVITILAPFIASLPFSFSIIEDTKSGLIKNVFIRSSPLKYIKSQAVSATMWGGLIFLIIYSIQFIIFYVIDPAPSPMILLPSATGYFASIYAESMLKFCIVFILHSSIVGSILAFFAYSLAVNIRNRITVLILPTAALYMFSTIDNYFSLFSSTFYILPFDVFNIGLFINFYTHIINLLVLILISFFLLLIGYKKLRDGSYRF